MFYREAFYFTYHINVHNQPLTDRIFTHPRSDIALIMFLKTADALRHIAHGVALPNDNLFLQSD